MNKKINFYIIFLLIIITYVFVTLSYKYYNQIHFVDDEEGFLIEQFALIIGIFDINKSVISSATYGVDFYYFKYFFLLINFVKQIDLIDVFRIKSFINALSAIIAFFTIYRIFDLLKFHRVFYFLFLVLIISTPEIIILTVSLKQDLNLLFLALVLTYYFFLKSSIFKNQKDAYLFIFFLSLSLSIKAWAFPFIFLLLFDKFDYLKDISKVHKILFGILIFLFVLFLNLYFIEIKNFISLDRDFLLFYEENVKNIFLNNIILVFKNYFYFFLIILNILLIVSLKIFFSINNYRNLLVKYLLFIISWFLIWYPYISDLNIFTKTIIEHSDATVLNRNSTTYSNYENIISYFIYDLINYKFNIGVFIVFISSPIIVYFNKNYLINNFKNIIPLLFLSYFCLIFVNLITDYPNQYPAKYLYSIFVIIFVFYLTNIIFKKKNIFRIFLLIFFIPSIFSIFVNFEKYSYPLKYFNLDKKIKKIAHVHQNKLDLENKNLYTCGTTYPIDTNISKINIIRKSFDDCLISDFVDKIKNDDLLYFRDEHKNFNKISNHYYLYYDDEYKMPGRLGRITNKKNLFYKKLEAKNLQLSE